MKITHTSGGTARLQVDGQSSTQGGRSTSHQVVHGGGHGGTIINGDGVGRGRDGGTGEGEGEEEGDEENEVDSERGEHGCGLVVVVLVVLVGDGLGTKSEIEVEEGGSGGEWRQGKDRERLGRWKTGEVR